MSKKLPRAFKYAALVSSLSVLAAIQGCSDETTAVKDKPQAAAVAAPVAEAAAPAPAAPTLAEQGVTVLPAPAALSGSDEYYQIKSGMDLLRLYNANLNEPVVVAQEMESIAFVPGIYQGNKQLEDAIQKYTGSSDQFEKKDLAGQIGPLLNEAVSQLKGVRYVAYDVEGAINLGDYDFERQAFKVNNSLATKENEADLVPYTRRALGFNDAIRYKLSFLNLGKIEYVKVPEDIARKINEYKKQNSTSMRIYGYLHSIAEDKADSYHQRYSVVDIQKIEVASSTLDERARQVFTTVEL